jgi:hypothetical protein
MRRQTKVYFFLPGGGGWLAQYCAQGSVSLLRGSADNRACLQTPARSAENHEFERKECREKCELPGAMESLQPLRRNFPAIRRITAGNA